MAAGNYSVVRAKSATQAGAFVDQVAFSRSGTRFMLDNRHATVNISYTLGSSSAPADPTSLGDDTYYCPAGGFRSLTFEQPVGYVKLIGDAVGMVYTVAIV